MPYDGVTDSIDMIFNNVGLSTPDAMILLVVCLGLIFAYQDHKIGLIALFLMSMSLVVFFFLTGVDTLKPMALMFMSIIAMAFSIYYSRQKGGLF